MTSSRLSNKFNKSFETFGIVILFHEFASGASQELPTNSFLNFFIMPYKKLVYTVEDSVVVHFNILVTKFLGER